MALGAEEDVHRAVTAAWVDSRPLDIVLRREVLADDGAGGTTQQEQILISQTFRLDRSSGRGVQIVTTEAGTSLPERFRLVGDRTADVQANDEFEVDGRRFLVSHVHFVSFERVAAEVEYRGG